MSSAPPMHAGSDLYVPPVALYPEGETVRIVENAEDRGPTPDSQVSRLARAGRGCTALAPDGVFD